MNLLDLGGARLLFDRKTGKNILFRVEETAHLTQCPEGGANVDYQRLRSPNYSMKMIGAGSLFMSITSDKKVVSRSYAEGGIPFKTYDDLPGIYRVLKEKNDSANVPGCTRTLHFGMNRQLKPAVDYPEVRR